MKRSPGMQVRNAGGLELELQGKLKLTGRGSRVFDLPGIHLGVPAAVEQPGRTAVQSLAG